MSNFNTALIFQATPPPDWESLQLGGRDTAVDKCQNGDEHEGEAQPHKTGSTFLGLQGPYSERFIFLVTFELAQQDRVLHITTLERVDRHKLHSLLDPS
jgi:hypothetical protein